jgi:hypothetical protein
MVTRNNHCPDELELPVRRLCVDEGRFVEQRPVENG